MLLTPELTVELCNYVFATACGQAVHFDPAAGPLAALLDQHRVNVCYLDDRVLPLAEVQKWLGQADFSGWRLVAGGDQPGRLWRLLTRPG